jgi:hypothetical protein
MMRSAVLIYAQLRASSAVGVAVRPSPLSARSLAAGGDPGPASRHCRLAFRAFECAVESDTRLGPACIWAAANSLDASSPQKLGRGCVLHAFHGGVRRGHARVSFARPVFLPPGQRGEMIRSGRASRLRTFALTLSLAAVAFCMCSLAVPDRRRIGNQLAKDLWRVRDRIRGR